MDLSKILLLGGLDEEDGSEEKEDSNGEGKGIYSITVDSHNGRFVKCFNIRVDRSPSASYDPPEGYRKISSAQSISMGGAHIVEEFTPGLLLDVDTLILLLETGTNPTKGSASGIELKILSRKERYAMYKTLYDVEATFRTMLKAAGITAVNLTFTGQSTKCLRELNFGYDNKGPAFIDGMLSRRITPAVFMQIVYSGFGLILLQTDTNRWELTDTMTMVKSSTSISVSAENIASLRSSYDYKKMAKYTHIALDATGAPSASIVNDGSVSQEVAKISYGLSDTNKIITANKESVATGVDIELSSPAMPLLRFSSFTDVTIEGKGEDAKAVKTFTNAECFDGERVEAKAIETPKPDDGFKKEPASSGKVNYDVSALMVKLRGMFAKNLHALMTFRNGLESANLSITFDGVVLPAFNSFTTGGAGSLQKVIISPTEAERVTEEADVASTGFIMGCRITRSSGRVVSTISYADISKAYPLVFDKSPAPAP